MKAAAIRSLFLKYFEKNGHTIVDSSSLVPQNDPTLLFTNAGMVQFKDVFLGKETRSFQRAVTSQKCVRAGGKHNDLENVGFTARHHTFFEMLGNFSFGDYFKKDAIHFAWEFVTQELKLPKDRLYVTVFQDDQEAADLWHFQEGLPLDRIYRFGEKDNFWSMGETGPCGPCSEIFIDRGEIYSCGKPSCGMGCDCDRFMEFWNLVFMQYERDSTGHLKPLPRPSVDTGAGLERIASILQSADSNYDTDIFQEVIAAISNLATQKYDPKLDTAVSFRVVADHARAVTFLIGDGVLPSNEGRGYVLRRIMRRAIRHGKKLGFSEPFLYRVTESVIRQMSQAYPDLLEKQPFIQRIVLGEEEQFLKTLERGLALLAEETAELKKGQVLPGEMAFKLYDTYGFPLDLTRVICEEEGLGIDEAGFEKAMNQQRSESRKHWKGSGERSVDPLYLKLAQDLKGKLEPPHLYGQASHQIPGECLALLVSTPEGLTSVDALTTPTRALTLDGATAETEPESFQAIFSDTPFYGESGGQVGDHGQVNAGRDFEGEVVDVQKPLPELVVVHIRPVRGTIRIGKKYIQDVDMERRARTARNHTATHLLHWALRKVLGTHVKQAGSIVAPEYLRFDFSHFQPMTEAQLLEVETLINQKIWAAEPVTKTEMAKEAAIAGGAIAMFGEKYGDRVRVVQVGSFSTELCGGSHVNQSSDIHLFKIANESGIAAGVRRILAYTSQGAFQYLSEKLNELNLVRDHLKASNSTEIIGKIEKIQNSERDLRKQLDSLQAQSAGNEVEDILLKAETLNQVLWVAAICAPHPEGVKRLREIADRIKQKTPEVCIVLGIVDPDGTKASILVSIGAKAPAGLSANAIVQKIAPLIQGKGGGKADLAQAGGNKPDGLPAALVEAKKWVETQIQKIP
jgi:alanyl-tRNA synthetase